MQTIDGTEIDPLELLAKRVSLSDLFIGGVLASAGLTREDVAQRLGATPEQALRLWLTGVPSRAGDLEAIADRLCLDAGKLSGLWAEVNGGG